VLATSLLSLLREQLIGSALECFGMRQ
jgi:hypothetical protein